MAEELNGVCLVQLSCGEIYLKLSGLAVQRNTKTCGAWAEIKRSAPAPCAPCPKAPGINAAQMQAARYNRRCGKSSIRSLSGAASCPCQKLDFRNRVVNREWSHIDIEMTTNCKKQQTETFCFPSTWAPSFKIFLLPGPLCRRAWNPGSG